MSLLLRKRVYIKFKVTFVEKSDDFPDWIDPQKIALFLHESLKPFEDPLDEILAGVEQALSGCETGGGFVALAMDDTSLLGVLVMLSTRMRGYVPPNLLLYVAVSPSSRGKGIGAELIARSLDRCEGPVKLHVEYDNPARRLYERFGFESKYAEMRRQ